MIKKVKEALDRVDHVSTTADVWMAHYLGMAAHWIEQKSLKWQKAVIACVRLTGHHTYDVLAASIEEIHENYGLSGKVTATVTDNGKW